MALVKVKQFFMSNEDIAKEKRGSMYALYMTEVYAEKAAQPQMIKGVGYAGQRIAVAAEENRSSNDVLKILALKKSGYRFGNRFLTRFNMTIGWTYLVAGTPLGVKSELRDEFSISSIVMGLLPSL